MYISLSLASLAGLSLLIQEEWLNNIVIIINIIFSASQTVQYILYG